MLCASYVGIPLPFYFLELELATRARPENGKEPMNGASSGSPMQQQKSAEPKQQSWKKSTSVACTFECAFSVGKKIFAFATKVSYRTSDCLPNSFLFICLPVSLDLALVFPSLLSCFISLMCLSRNKCFFCFLNSFAFCCSAGFRLITRQGDPYFLPPSILSQAHNNLERMERGEIGYTSTLCLYFFFSSMSSVSLSPFSLNNRQP